MSPIEDFKAGIRPFMRVFSSENSSRFRVIAVAPLKQYSRCLHCVILGRSKWHNYRRLPRRGGGGGGGWGEWQGWEFPS